MPLAAILALPVRAQEETEPVTLARAVVVEVYEHDLGRAMDLYRQIAGDEARPGEERTQALLHLAKAHRRLGQNEEADGYFAQAAAGTGPGAQEAKAIRSGAVQDQDDLVKAKVDQALMTLRVSGDSNNSTDLQWIGEPAVPYIIAAIDAEKADLTFITTATRVLCILGGPRVVEWIDTVRQGNDSLRKRAVIKGTLSGGEARRAAIAAFLDDPDPAVRREVLEMSDAATLEQLLRALDDEDGGVVAAAWIRLCANWKALVPVEERLDLFEEGLVPRFQGGWGRSGSSMPGSLWRWIEQDWRSMNGDRVRRFALELMRFEQLRNLRVGWPAVESPVATNAFAADVLGTARAIGSVQGAGAAAHTVLAGLVDDLLPHWDHEAMPVVFELIDLGYGTRPSNRRTVPRFGTYLAEYARPEDLEGVCARLARLDPTNLMYAAPWLRDRNIPPEAFRGLTAAVDQNLGNLQGSSQARTSLEHLFAAIAAVETDQAEEYLVEKIRHGAPADWAFDGASPMRKRILMALLTWPDGPSRSEVRPRGRAFAALARNYEDPGEPEAFAEAYGLGLDERPQGEGLDMIVSSASVMGGLGRRAQIIDRCLATGEEAAFYHVARTTIEGTYPPPLRTAILRRILECPGDERYRVNVLSYAMQNLAVGPQRDGAFLLEMLEDDMPGVRRLGLSRIASSSDPVDRAREERLLVAVEARLGDADPAVVSRAVDSLFARYAETAERHVEELLGHDDGEVRYRLGRGLLQYRGHAELDRVGPLLVDDKLPNTRRRSLATMAGNTMDLQAIPYLLEAMKDATIREDIEKVLNQIRFYHDEKGKWERLAAGTGLGVSAAEALIKQAREGASREIKIAAIASLGTLGEAETLPFLVQMMGDADAEIAAAAKAAVDKINSKTPDK